MKHNIQNPSNSKLHYVDWFKLPLPDDKVKKSDVKSSKMKILNFGKKNRYVNSVLKILFGINPKYLNATSLLNIIIDISGKITPGVVAKILKELNVYSKNIEEINLVTIVNTINPKSNWTKQKASYLAIFEKESLIPLLNTIDHSIAVTEKKLKHFKYD